jgi:hypothetical protein
MPAESLLLAIATIAVVVAGFTAVTSSLVPPGGSWQPMMRIRQRGIVSTSFNVMFESLAPSIAFAWLGNAHDALVLASLGVAAYCTVIVSLRSRQFIRAGSYRTRSSLVLFTLGPTATLLFWANAGIFASVAVYAFALCIQLSVAVVSFYSLVSAAQG